MQVGFTPLAQSCCYRGHIIKIDWLVNVPYEIGWHPLDTSIFKENAPSPRHEHCADFDKDVSVHIRFFPRLDKGDSIAACPHRGSDVWPQLVRDVAIRREVEVKRVVSERRPGNLEGWRQRIGAVLTTGVPADSEHITIERVVIQEHTNGPCERKRSEFNPNRVVDAVSQFGRVLSPKVSRSNSDPQLRDS